MASMVQFVKTTEAPNDDKTAILVSRGEGRNQYLVKYLAYTIA